MLKAQKKPVRRVKPKAQRRRRRRPQGKVITERKGSGVALRTPLYSASVASSMIVGTKLTSTRFRTGKIEGVKLSGMFPIASIQYTEDDKKAYVGSCIFPTVDPTNAYESLPINPQQLFSEHTREYFESFPFGQFNFKKIRFIYVSQSASSNQASIAVGYYPDARGNDLLPFPLPFGELITFPNSITCPVWTSGVSLDVTSQLTQNWFYTDNVMTAANDRTSIQGLFLAQFGSVVGLTSGQTVGIIYLDYTVDLIEPRYVLDDAKTLSVRQTRQESLRSKHRVKNLSLPGDHLWSRAAEVAESTDSKGESGWGIYPTVPGGESLPPFPGSSGSVISAGALAIGSQAHLQGEPSGWVTTEEDGSDRPVSPVVVPVTVKPKPVKALAQGK